jgi:cytosine/adenosine deaminase-related metal-dependent hydrolase
MFKMAMEGGARALGHPGEIGILRAGAKADIAVVNPSSHWHRPFGDPWHHLAYYESGVGVERVYADGKILLDGGKLTTIDEDAILAEAEEIIGRQQQDREEADRFIARQYPAFRDMVVETLRREDPIDRLVRLR